MDLNPSRVGCCAGEYWLEDLLDAGASGEVYASVHRSLGSRAAVKMLRPELPRTASAIQRFAREARAASVVHHRNVVDILGAGVLADSTPYIVMEMLHGQSLGAALSQRRPLRLAVALDYALQTAEALAAIHRGGVVHRDVKPDNLFLAHEPAMTPRRRVKLLDFGAALIGSPGALRETTTPGPIGTPLYMSPEQFDGVADERSDVYALGVVLYEMLCGAPPFEASRVNELWELHRHATPPALGERRPAMPPALVAVVMRALAKRPAARFSSASAMAAALRACIRARASAPRSCDAGAGAVPT